MPEPTQSEIKRVEVHLEGDLREFVEGRKERDGIPYASTVKKALTELMVAESEKKTAN